MTKNYSKKLRTRCSDKAITLMTILQTKFCRNYKLGARWQELGASGTKFYRKYILRIIITMAEYRYNLEVNQKRRVSPYSYYLFLLLKTINLRIIGSK